MKSEPVHAPPRRRPWLLILASVLGIAWAGVARFDGLSRALPLDEAIRTLVACPAQNERELALGVIGSRAHELVTILAIHSRTDAPTAGYAASYLRKLAQAIDEEKSK